MVTSKQKGFSAIELLLVLAVVGLIGFISWYVIKENNEDKAQKEAQMQSGDTTDETQTAQESATVKQDEEHYSVETPRGWQKTKTDTSNDDFTLIRYENSTTGDYFEVLRIFDGQTLGGDSNDDLSWQYTLNDDGKSVASIKDVTSTGNPYRKTDDGELTATALPPGPFVGEVYTFQFGNSHSEDANTDVFEQVILTFKIK